MYLSPVSAHLLTVFTASIEIGYLVSAKNIVHILGQFCLQGGHNSELLTNKYLSKKFMGSCEYHCLLFEVFDMCSFGQKLRHITNLMSSFPGKHITGARQNGCSDKNRHIRKICYQLFH